MVFTPTFYRSEKLKEECSFLSICTKDGVELEGVIYEPNDAKETLLLFAGRSHDVVGIINKLSECYPSTRVISFNYRSYGRSGGNISEENILSDSLEIADLVKKHYGAFFLLGYSLGSNVASFVASKREIKALFLVGAFDSIASLAKSKFVDKGIFPMLDLSKFFRYKLETGKYVQHVDADTYLFVSKSDETTYIENARVLKSRIKNLKYYVELDDVTHDEILWKKEVVEVINEALH